mgnify:CR=1 FL=1
MSPTEKRVVVNILDRNKGHYTAKCLHELYFEAHVLYSDMQKLRLCVDAAKENPHHLDLGIPETESEGGYDSRVAPGLVAGEAVNDLPAVNEGLRSFQLKPRGLTGHVLFEHMVQFRMRNSEQTQPSPKLGVEMTERQVSNISPSIHDLTVKAILKDAGGEGATK